jgi:hypothetical protein
MATIKNTNNNKCCQGYGVKEPSYTAGGNVNYIFLRLLKKTKK